MTVVNKKDGREQRRFFVAMADAERIQAQENMKYLKAKYKISLSSVLRKVILKHIDDENFLENIGILEKTDIIHH